MIGLEEMHDMNLNYNDPVRITLGMSTVEQIKAQLDMYDDKAIVKHITTLPGNIEATDVDLFFKKEDIK